MIEIKKKFDLYKCDSPMCDGEMFLIESDEFLLSCPYCDQSMVSDESLKTIEIDIGGNEF